MTDPHSEVSVDTLRTLWREWADANGNRTRTKQELGADLKGAYPQVKVRRVGGHDPSTQSGRTAASTPLRRRPGRQAVKGGACVQLCIRATSKRGWGRTTPRRRDARVCVGSVIATAGSAPTQRGGCVRRGLRAFPDAAAATGSLHVDGAGLTYTAVCE